MTGKNAARHVLTVVGLVLGLVGSTVAMPAQASRMHTLQDLDFGDAPDSYQTLLASNGACHIVGLPFWMGLLVDAEPDGQPSPLADGDDLNSPTGADDEDGVILLTALVAGTAALVTVDGGPSGGMLDAWIDFNGNSRFDDPAEHLWAGVSQPLVPGVNPALPFAVPANAMAGRTYARFRLSVNGSLPPFGLATEGEVEDYEVLIEGEPIPLDWGDAPDTYQTLFVSNGPRHVIVAGIWLGPVIDGEGDGLPSPLADGDDLNALPDDEDGVTLPAALVPGNTAQVTVDGGGAGGMLDAWIDFNGNGVFDDPAEHLWAGASQPVGPGPNPPLVFQVPLSALPGQTYARFRLSINGTLRPFGLATEGEVEDYLVAIEAIDLDYGDAPDTYQTLLASDGARHVQGPDWMGPTVDVEADGNPSALADGDDLLNLADEDGVTLPAVFWAGDPAAQVTVEGGPIGGMVDAWIDFNGNSMFDDPAEHLWAGVSQPVGPGPNLLTFAVPASAATGKSYARFRISINGALPPFGFAPDGEVEDYLVAIELFTLDYAAGPNGSLTGNTHQTVPYGGNGTAVTAIADTGYGFVYWSDGLTANPRQDINVTANVNVTAIFDGILGDVNKDGLVNSTDALIVLSADADIDTPQYCPMNCGDVNADGLVNSTDALIILTYDAGLPVGSLPVGQPGCPTTVTQPPGCS